MNIIGTLHSTDRNIRKKKIYNKNLWENIPRSGSPQTYWPKDQPYIGSPLTSTRSTHLPIFFCITLK